VTVLLISNALVWIALIGLLLAVLALARQVGILHERLTPVGALTMDHGPKVGEPAPVFTLPKLGGGEIRIGATAGRSQLLFFLSPTCPVCKQLLPVLRSLSQHEGASLDVVLASDGALDEHQRFYVREKLAPFPYVLSTDLGMTFRISKLPYAVVIGQGGVISAKGLINNREQLESLLVAQEMGVASLQDYRAKTRNHAAARIDQERP
jgi:methylamine dehydrogenase accessory protein MauD